MAAARSLDSASFVYLHVGMSFGQINAKLFLTQPYGVWARLVASWQSSEMPDYTMLNNVLVVYC